MVEHAGMLPSTTTTDSTVTDPEVAILPVGSFEQHGPHLPLVTDTLVAIAISDAVARVHPVRQLPPITVSCSHEHSAFAGTVSISATTLTSIVTDIAGSLALQGIHRLFVVNGHGGNYVLANVVQQANTARPGSMVLFPARADWDDARRAAAMTSDLHDDMHAGELETSILLAAFPDYLRDGWQEDDHLASERRALHTVGMAAYTTSGVIGRPSLGEASKGRACLDELGRLAVAAIREPD